MGGGGLGRGVRGLLARAGADGYWSEASALLRSRGRARAEKRFVIFGQGRTGSTLLTESLNAHPDIRCEGEILKRRVRSPRTFVENRARLARTRAYGFKVKIYQLTRDQGLSEIPEHHAVRAFLRSLSDDGWRLIHLRRRNLLRHAVSSLLLVRTGVAHRRREERLAKVVVDCDLVVRRMMERESFAIREEAALQALPHRAVVYEDHLLDPADRARCLTEIVGELGLAPCDGLTTSLRRNTPPRLEDLIENYDELAEALAPTRFAKFLDDASYELPGS
jgi:LPS sulfotransferase NodH